jgi:anaerobic selenocysteine-containing dehydrogenase
MKAEHSSAGAPDGCARDGGDRATLRLMRRYGTCPLCEATCGIAIDLDESGAGVAGIRGDADDPFSRGYICPKAHGLKSLTEDPDRLRRPLVRVGRDFAEVSWDEALGQASSRLLDVRKRHGADAIAIYLGNPGAHSLDAMLYNAVLIRALGTVQRYSASSADQLPKMVSAGLMFGRGLAIPVPDIDRTQRLLLLGANPLVSNGSLMTAPDVRVRLDDIRGRGGQVIAIDPRRTETAARASEHHFIRPGTDALLLLALVEALFAGGRVRLGAAEGRVRGLDQVRALAARFPAERVAGRSGIPAETIRRLAREQADAPSAACYGRIGTTCQEFGTLASWAVDLVNILTGNLDRPGGAMFTTPAAQPGRYKRRTGLRFGRFKSRVKGLPEMFGELPVSTLADEILTPGEGQVRALVTVAGNPLVSAPNAGRLAEAVAGLELRVAVDIYVNETTRLADIILPPPGPLSRAAYDLALYQLAVRNVAKFSEPALPRDDGQPAEWEILLSLAKGVQGMAAVPLAAADDLVARELVQREVGELIEREPDALGGLGAAEVMAALGDRRGPARLVDLLLRIGPHGDRFGRRPGGLHLDALLAQPHGVDLGPLLPCLDEVLATPDRLIDLAPPDIAADVDRLDASLDRAPPEVVLIGRRNLRSNNSWMHNLTPLIKGPDRCTLLVHPDDAARYQLRDGGRARVKSRVGEVIAPVEVTDEVMPGVVSLPHGFGHDQPGSRLQVAVQHAGVNVNILSDDSALDVPSGNAAFNGVAVSLAAAE